MTTLSTDPAIPIPQHQYYGPEPAKVRETDHYQAEYVQSSSRNGTN